MQHLHKLGAVPVFAGIRNHLDAALLLTVGGLPGSAAEQQGADRAGGLEGGNAANCKVQRRVAGLIVDLQLRAHGQDVGDCEFGLLVASPVEGRAALVIDLVDVQVLMPCKVVKADGLVALGGDVETVGAVNIGNVHVGAHLIDHELDELEVAVVGREVEGGKLLVGVGVDPALHADVVEAAAVDVLVAVLKRVTVHGLEALGVVFES